MDVISHKNEVPRLDVCFLAFKLNRFIPAPLRATLLQSLLPSADLSKSKIAISNLNGISAELLVAFVSLDLLNAQV
jgi:hypothetical protein